MPRSRHDKIELKRKARGRPICRATAAVQGGIERGSLVLRMPNLELIPASLISVNDRCKKGLRTRKYEGKNLVQLGG
jgi:hypothetical protein